MLVGKISANPNSISVQILKFFSIHVVLTRTPTLNASILPLALLDFYPKKLTKHSSPLSTPFTPKSHLLTLLKHFFSHHSNKLFFGPSLRSTTKLHQQLLTRQISRKPVFSTKFCSFFLFLFFVTPLSLSVSLPRSYQRTFQLSTYTLLFIPHTAKNKFFLTFCHLSTHIARILFLTHRLAKKVSSIVLSSSHIEMT